jgi:hypothetical protein
MINKKKDLYIEFDNGKKLSPKDIANLMVRLRTTGSMEEVVRVISLEYEFTVNDFMKFRNILRALVDNWEILDGWKDKK